MKSRNKPLSAIESVRACADKMRIDSGQGYSDQVMRAHDQFAVLLMAAESVVEAKEIYYSQRVDNDDALDVALTLWADRVDTLARALDGARA